MAISKLNEKEDLTMKCPCCGNEMIKGWVQSARRILFTTTKGEGGLTVKDKNDVVLSSNNFFNPTCVAYHCGTCKKVVVDYAEKTE